MSNDWALIAKGLALASLGAGASMLYIVGVSAAYMGWFGEAGTCLLAGLGTALAFRGWLTPYLAALEQRDSLLEEAPPNATHRDVPYKSAETNAH